MLIASSVHTNTHVRPTIYAQHLDMESPRSPLRSARPDSRAGVTSPLSKTPRVTRRTSTNSHGLGTPTYSKDMVPLHSTIGQVSFAPTTKTTVVTTTTTTTTSFPPFVMKAPKNLEQRDALQYPLAASPTPQAIRKLRFDIGGQTAYLNEANESFTQEGIKVRHTSSCRLT